MTEVIISFTGRFGFLSSFWHADFHYQNIIWPTAEHAFQAMKHPDPGAWPSFALISSPQEAKKAGRRITARSDWEQVKRSVMLKITLAKFGQNSELRGYLAQTAPAVLIEGNTWGDTYWGAIPVSHTLNYRPGSGRPAEMPTIWKTLRDPDSWLTGENWLGRILMMTREVLS